MTLPDPPESNNPAWQSAFVKATGGRTANIRSKPSTGATFVGSLMLSEAGGLVVPDESLWHSNVGDPAPWVPVSIAGTRGWARKDVFTWRLITPVPPKTFMPLPPEFVADEQKRKELVELFRWMADIVEQYPWQDDPRRPT